MSRGDSLAENCVRWQEGDAEFTASWRSEAGVLPPKRVVVADDRLTADAAYRLACEGTAMLWRGDFQNARQLLQAMARRIDRRPRKTAGTVTENFHLYRQAQAQRARALGMLLLPVEANYRIPLRRAPDVSAAMREAHGECDEPFVISLRELQGLVGAHEWRKKGVEIPGLDARIHPHYGVFSPVRGEYLDLVAAEPLPATCDTAYDIGTGTGVLAALLARRGVPRIVATDLYSRALGCAADNIARLGLQAVVELSRADLFPVGQAALIVCNPPWLPGKPASALEHAVYDPDSKMLRGFLAGLATHLLPGGEGWLILSDFAEHLGLRSRAQLIRWIEDAGLTVAGRSDIRPRHSRATDPSDPLHRARAAEVTSLWRLTPNPGAAREAKAMVQQIQHRGR